MTLTEALGAEIRAEAAAQRLTIAGLAKLADVNRSSLYTWLDAKTAFPVQGLAALAGVLHVPPTRAHAPRRDPPPTTERRE